jgi:hypothetical protein
MGLEEKRAADIAGPLTFGEITHQPLNQTLMYLLVEDQ